MNAFSEDLPKKIVKAKERGMPTVEAVRTFGVGISCVKRCAKTARQGGSLRPKRSPRRTPKADERARRLLEADLKARPVATLSDRREYLRAAWLRRTKAGQADSRSALRQTMLHPNNFAHFATSEAGHSAEFSTHEHLGK